MALLPILRFPDPRLKKVAQPVAQIDAGIRKLVADMAETMYEAPGIGLAATQVDVHKRVVVIDVSEEKNNLLVFINPTLSRIARASRSARKAVCRCPVSTTRSSVPSGSPSTISTSTASSRRMEADGLLAVCIQHEIDHLNGIVFVDHLSQLKQGRIKSKLAKQARVTA